MDDTTTDMGGNGLYNLNMTERDNVTLAIKYYSVCGDLRVYQFSP